MIGGYEKVRERRMLKVTQSSGWWMVVPLTEIRNIKEDLTFKNWIFFFLLVLG